MREPFAEEIFVLALILGQKFAVPKSTTDKGQLRGRQFLQQCYRLAHLKRTQQRLSIDITDVRVSDGTPSNVTCR